MHLVIDTCGHKRTTQLTKKSSSIYNGHRLHSILGPSSHALMTARVKWEVLTFLEYFLRIVTLMRTWIQNGLPI